MKQAPYGIIFSISLFFSTSIVISGSLSHDSELIGWQHCCGHRNANDEKQAHQEHHRAHQASSTRMSCASVSITSCSVPGYHWEESGSLFFIPSHQMFIHTDKISPEPSFCQAKQSQLVQPQLIGKMLQALSHHCGPSLDSFQHVHVSLDWGAQL